MEEQLFPYANIVAGVLILVIGFLIHCIGQSISLLNWDFAAKLGIAEKSMIPEFKAYEKGIAAADVMLGLIYGVAAVGLILNAAWAYKLAWFPAVVFIYHSLSFWFWSGNQIKLGHRYNSDRFRVAWFLANFISGILTVLVIW